jgi:tRNA pseudouridine synthase 10
MNILEKALQMLEARPLCDHCLGRQFALLGYSIENYERGKAIKLSLALQASFLCQSKESEGLKNLKILARNGFSRESTETIRHLKKRVPKRGNTCFLCQDRFQLVDNLVQKALEEIAGYEYTTFLVGVELPVVVEEREDEFRATFSLSYSESLRHEFGRLLGKRIEVQTGKLAEYRKPDLVIITNPFAESFKVQVNPLFVAGRYRKLVRDIPQSKWFCSACWGKGCERCGWTGKLYSESVEELVSNPLLEAAEGEKTAFHASGREDIDARMLGSGRPFVVEVSKPRKRFLDLRKLKELINLGAKGKVEVSSLRFANKDSVRRLKKAESTQKEYRVLVEFESDVSDESLCSLEKTLSNTVIKQQTPLRVLHRRADLVREKYIYEVKVKKVSPRKAEMQIRCQGGLYVKELVSGDEGRTTPSVSELLGNRAKPLRLDVLNVIMEGSGEVKK